MKYAPDAPPQSVPCGTGQLVISGASTADQAETLARLGGSENANVQINRVVQQALLADAALANWAAELTNPQISYTVGRAIQLGPLSWAVPFEAFLWERTQSPSKP